MSVSAGKKKKRSTKFEEQYEPKQLTAKNKMRKTLGGIDFTQ